MNPFVFIIVGLIAGWLARQVMNGGGLDLRDEDNSMKVAVIGGIIAGFCAAFTLGRIGVDVDIVERSQKEHL